MNSSNLAISEGVFDEGETIKDFFVITVAGDEEGTIVMRLSIGAKESRTQRQMWEFKSFEKM